jgi:hypothetical protein
VTPIPLSELLAGPLGPVLTELEAVRREETDRFLDLLKWVGAVLAFVCILAFLFKAAPLVYFLVALAAIGFLLMNRQKGTSRVCGLFRARVIPYLLEGISPGLEYWPADGIDEDEFYASGLFISPDRYFSHDLVSGIVGRTDLRFSLVHAEEEYEETVYETETDSDGNSTTVSHTETRWRDIFQGLFFSADFHKHFHGYTRVTPGGRGLFGRFSSSAVKLEDPRFTKRFSVSSSDQVEARYLLTPAMMERILAVDDRFGGRMQIAFSGSRVIIAVSMGWDSLSPNIRAPLITSRETARIYNLLEQGVTLPGCFAAVRGETLPKHFSPATICWGMLQTVLPMRELRTEKEKNRGKNDEIDEKDFRGSFVARHDAVAIRLPCRGADRSRQNSAVAKYFRILTTRMSPTPDERRGDNRRKQ